MREHSHTNAAVEGTTNRQSLQGLNAKAIACRIARIRASF